MTERPPQAGDDGTSPPIRYATGLDWVDEQLGALQRDFPEHDIWYVRHYVGGGTWCSRPKGHKIATLNADSPDHLREYLLAEISGPDADVMPDHAKKLRSV